MYQTIDYLLIFVVYILPPHRWFPFGRVFLSPLPHCFSLHTLDKNNKKKEKEEGVVLLSFRIWDITKRYLFCRGV